MSIFFTIVGGLIIISLIGVITFDDQDYLEDIKQIEATGIVSKKVDQSWNHGTKLLRISTDDEQVTLNITRNIWVQREYFKEHDTYLNPLWEYVNEGDSLSKQANSWYVQIKKPNSTWKQFKLSLGQQRYEERE